MNIPAKPDAAPAPLEETEAAPTRRDFIRTLAAAAGTVVLATETTSGYAAAAAAPVLSDTVDWAAFLRRHDLVWDAAPLRWEDGAFIGDGQQGAMAFADGPGASTLRFEINRSDVTDRGKRLAVGQLHIPFPVSSAPFNMRVDLWNGEIVSDNGFRAYAHASDRVLVWETPHAGEITWHPEPALDARKLYRKEPMTDAEKHPGPTQTMEPDGTHVCVQPLTGGSAWAVAWREDPAAGGAGTTARRVLLSVGYSAKSSDEAKSEAVQQVQKAAKRSSADLTADHGKWWHDFWPQSFLSIPDARMESFYYIQMYKLASATGKNKPTLDLMGPWFRTTPWTAIWWNLNIQLTYWPIYGSGRFDLGTSLLDMLDANTQNLSQNVENPTWQSDSEAIGRVSSYDCRGKAGSELGNLTWTLHNYFWHCRAQGDDARLKNHLFPHLKRAVSYLIHHTTENEDGHLHLPVDISPEYPVKAADTNYNLGLLRWGCRTLLAMNTRYKVGDKADIAAWQETLAKLAPYPADKETGLHIGAGVPLTQSHRHFSHLLMVFPLQNLTPDTPEARALIEKTLDHWINFKGALQGYSYTGASAISTILGRKTEAVQLLNTFLDKYVKTNTMYTEAGPVIETPLSAACAIHYLLLRDARQGTDGNPFDTTLHVFSGVPDSWQDAAFYKLRAGAAFAVSANRKNGATQWVHIHSTSGEPCKIVTGLRGPIEARGKRKFALQTDDATGVTTVDLKKNESVLLVPQETPANFVPTIAPVTQDAARFNTYGLKRV